MGSCSRSQRPGGKGHSFIMVHQCMRKQRRLRLLLQSPCSVSSEATLSLILHANRKSTVTVMALVRKNRKNIIPRTCYQKPLPQRTLASSSVLNAGVCSQATILSSPRSDQEYQIISNHHNHPHLLSTAALSYPAPPCREVSRISAGSEQQTLRSVNRFFVEDRRPQIGSDA